MKLSAKVFKKALAFQASTLEEVAGILPTGEPVVATVKVDGELEVWDVDVAAGVAQCWNQNERERIVLPIRRELLASLRAAGHQQARGAGELYAVDRQGRPLPRHEVLSQVKTRTKATTPVGDQQALRLAIFDLFQLDGTVLWQRAPYADRFVALQAIFGGGTFVKPVAGRTGVQGEDPIRALWTRHVLEENFEGLVLRTNGAVKVKPLHTLDLAVLAVQQGKGQHRDTAGALVLGFRDWTGRFLEAGKVGSGLAVADRDWWWRTPRRVTGPPFGKGAEARRTTFVEPGPVIEVAAESFTQRPVRAFRWDAATRDWAYVGHLPGAVLQQARYVRRREDKDLSPQDLRLEQVPGWKASAAGVKIPDRTANGTTFADLLTVARSDLARFASRMQIPPDEREDVIQNTTLKALSAWRRLTESKTGFAPGQGMPKPGELLIPWLFTVLANTWKSRCRELAFRKTRLAALETQAQAMRARAAVRAANASAAARVNPKRRAAARRTG